MKKVVFSVCAAALLSACATNPVTGKKELSFVGEDWELQVGAEPVSYTHLTLPTTPYV